MKYLKYFVYVLLGVLLVYIGSMDADWRIRIAEIIAGLILIFEGVWVVRSGK